MPRTLARLCYHIVFATKHRTPWIEPELEVGLYPLIGAIVRNHRGTLLAIGGMPDHLHLLVDLRPHPSVADVVKAVKGISSRWMNEQERTTDQFAWQEGYSAFSVSPSVLGKVKAYVLRQQEHHQQASWIAEQRSLLARHAVSFEESDLEA